MHLSENKKYSIRIERNILIVDAGGPFNDQTMKRYRADIVEAIQSLSGEKWQQIVTVNETTIFTPEGLIVLEQSVANRKSLGLSYSAVVLTTKTKHQSLIKHQLSQCYNNVGVEHGYFDSLTEALSYLSGSNSKT